MDTRRRSARLRSRMFLKNVLSHTPILGLSFLLVALWMLFSAALYMAEQGAAGTTIASYGRALYWGIAAFSTAGIADMPVSPASQMIGGVYGNSTRRRRRRARRDLRHLHDVPVAPA